MTVLVNKFTKEILDAYANYEFMDERMQADPNFSLDSSDGVYIVFLCIGNYRHKTGRKMVSIRLFLRNNSLTG